FKGVRLVFNALVHLANAELATAARDCARAASRDHRDLYAGAAQGPDAEAVVHVKDLKLLAACPVVKLAVGEHAIHIQHEQANGLGCRGACHDRYTTRARIRSWTFSAPI